MWLWSKNSQKCSASELDRLFNSFDTYLLPKIDLVHIGWEKKCKIDLFQLIKS